MNNYQDTYSLLRNQIESFSKLSDEDWELLAPQNIKMQLNGIIAK